MKNEWHEPKFHHCVFEENGKRCKKKAKWWGKLTSGKGIVCCEDHREQYVHYCIEFYPLSGTTIEKPSPSAR